MAETFPFEVGWVFGMREEDEQQSESNLLSQFHESAAANSSMASSAAPSAQKKKRAQLDPEAEVVALSPETLMATNRFICNVCNKRFHREQNLQLHRRRHSLPWSLKQLKSPTGARKKQVYVCPEPTCAHHSPSRALGDLNSAKKHFYRKHCEKNLKCEKCHKMYAVMSDLNAHYKTCGTKQYRCDCGIFFSRHDSFVMHRGLCHAVSSMNLSAITSQLFGSNNISTGPRQQMQCFQDQIADGFQYVNNGHILQQLSSSSTIHPASVTVYGSSPQYHEEDYHYHHYANSPNNLVFDGMIQQLPQDQNFFYNTASTHFSPSYFHANQFSQYSPSLQYSNDLQTSSFGTFLRDDQNNKNKTLCSGDYATYGEPKLSFLKLLEDEEWSNEQQLNLACESFDDGCDMSTRDLLGVGLIARQMSQGFSHHQQGHPMSSKTSIRGQGWDFLNG